MTGEQNNTPFKVAAVQAAPVFLDREATIDKACDLIATAGREGARLIVFPEAFIPSYPEWVWGIPPGEQSLLNELYAELLSNSITIPSDSTDKLCRAAKFANAYVVMGMSERNVEASGASLYNTMLYIDAQGEILGKHRKLVPTGGERLVWAQGDGSTLQVYDTPLGKLGGLICWENYMPLARYAMYAWGTQIYVAATWDHGQPWLSTLRHIAKEGRVYVIGCCIAMRKDDIPDRYSIKQKYYSDMDEWINVGDSAIVNPEGHFIAGPVRKQEEILYAEIDPRMIQGPKWMLDVAGHYARPDVFELTVHTDVREMMRVEEGS
ncbi:MAG TPA: carbon-nitrogen hydrolase family protein [Ktedonobacteraceae bacterium]|nr:carbon-nitrogen hydrolase family protein [Ktedonobacteraceae bacterium]